MAYQQSISELLGILNQEKTLISELYENSRHKRLYQKSELLKLCRENSERLDRLLQWEILKPRLGKFELNQSLLDAFLGFLRASSSPVYLSSLIHELKEQMSILPETAPRTGFLTHIKNLIRSVEEHVIQALEQKSLSQDFDEVDAFSKEMEELHRLIGNEQKLQVFRDTELDILIQDIEELIQEGLKSLKNIRIGLKKDNPDEYSLRKKIKNLQRLQVGQEIREKTNVERVLSEKFPLLWEDVQVLRPRIASQQLYEKSSLNLLSKFTKKRKKK